MVKARLDPTGEHGQTARQRGLDLGELHQRLIELMGILPHWVVDNDPRPAKEQFEEKYQFGCYPMKGGRVDHQGVFYFPGDPPLYPVASIERDREVVYFYAHAIVATVQKDNGRTLWMTRMD